MVYTMIPIGHGKQAAKKGPPELVVHTIGSLMGGLFMGALLGYLPGLLWKHMAGFVSLTSAAVAAIAIVYSLKEAELVKVPAPQSTWQVPRRWMNMDRRPASGMLYGFFLGCGLFTRISTCLYPIVVWAILAGQGMQSALVMSVFGISRTIPLWLIYWKCKGDVERRDRCIYVLNYWHQGAHLMNAMVLIFCGSVLVGSLLRTAKWT